MKRILILFLLLVVSAGIPEATSAQKKTKSQTNASVSAVAPEHGNVEGITAAQMKAYLTFVASDELEGRDTPSRGLDVAAMYIESHLKRWGIKPAGDNGTYFQRVPIRRTKIDTDVTKLDISGEPFKYGEDFLSNFDPASISNSHVVYVSHGWVVKSKNINPYEGIDVKDKIIVATNSLPKGVTGKDLQGKAGEDWMSPQIYAQKNGAKAVIAFGLFSNLANWQSARRNQIEKGYSAYGDEAPTPAAVPMITASPRLLSVLFYGEKVNAATLFNKAVQGEPAEAFELSPEKKINLSIAAKTEETYAQNVIGILEGSDPVLKNEYVAIGAHYDHVGMNPFFPGADKIFNGADDDGSGTVAVLAMAEAFAGSAKPPKRSILFIWHCGEEKGLWGSKYFTDHPTVPLASVTAELNIDMIGRYQNPSDENHPVNKQLPKPGEIFVIGSKMMSSELGEISEAANKNYLNLNFNYKYDDPNDPERFFYRSDHYNYARKGVPIIFYMDGVHADYHQASDSVEKINFEQMEKVARTIFTTGWELANRAARPKVDKPLAAQ